MNGTSPEIPDPGEADPDTPARKARAAARQGGAVGPARLRQRGHRKPDRSDDLREHIGALGRQDLKRLAVLSPMFALLVFVGGALWTGQRLAAPARAAVGPPPAHLPAREVWIESGSGSKLSGWFLPGNGGCAAVVLMHPVRENRLAMLRRAEFLWRAGYAVLLFDFQAHGESPGEHITFGHLESRDARAAVDYVAQPLPEAPVGVLGLSLGGAAAVLGQEPLGADAIILEAVYPTIEEAVVNRIRLRLGPLAELLAPPLLIQLQPRLGVSADQLRPVDRIHALDTPVLIIAGTEDRHTLLTESRRLFDKASGPKEFWAIEGAGHIDFHQFAREEYEGRILAFFSKYLRCEAT